MIYYYYVYHRLLKSKKWDCQQVSIRTASKPFWLRPGVSDWIALERIFFDREYDPVSKDVGGGENPRKYGDGSVAFTYRLLARAGGKKG